jgi:hypothetical protein
MKGIALYVAILLAISVAVGWLFSLAFPGVSALAAIRLSAVVAMAVQLAGFVAIRRLKGTRMLVGWGILALLRLITTVVYAVIAARVLGSPLAPAVLSIATVFFLSTLIEPLVLRV